MFLIKHSCGFLNVMLTQFFPTSACNVPDSNHKNIQAQSVSYILICTLVLRISTNISSPIMSIPIILNLKLSICQNVTKYMLSSFAYKIR